MQEGAHLGWASEPVRLMSCTQRASAGRGGYRRPGAEESRGPGVPWRVSLRRATPARRSSKAAPWDSVCPSCAWSANFRATRRPPIGPKFGPKWVKFGPAWADVPDCMRVCAPLQAAELPRTWPNRPRCSILGPLDPSFAMARNRPRCKKLGRISPISYATMLSTATSAAGHCEEERTRLRNADWARYIAHLHAGCCENWVNSGRGRPYRAESWSTLAAIGPKSIHVRRMLSKYAPLRQAFDPQWTLWDRIGANIGAADRLRAPDISVLIDTGARLHHVSPTSEPEAPISGPCAPKNAPAQHCNCIILTLCPWCIGTERVALGNLVQGISPYLFGGGGACRRHIFGFHPFCRGRKRIFRVSRNFTRARFSRELLASSRVDPAESEPKSASFGGDCGRCWSGPDRFIGEHCRRVHVDKPPLGEPARLARR